MAYPFWKKEKDVEKIWHFYNILGGSGKAGQEEQTSHHQSADNKGTEISIYMYLWSKYAYLKSNQAS